jgi:hypothetical protein
MNCLMGRQQNLGGCSMKRTFRFGVQVIVLLT